MFHFGFKINAGTLAITVSSTCYVGSNSTATSLAPASPPFPNCPPLSPPGGTVPPSTPTPTATPAASSLDQGAIIGGVVGGVLGLLLIVTFISLIVVYRRRHARSKEIELTLDNMENKDTSAQYHGSAAAGSTAFADAKGIVV